MRKFIIVIAALAMVCIIGTAAFSQTYPEGMVSYWKFDEGSGTTAMDSVGENDGTFFNGPVWITGIVGGALSLDGVDDYVNGEHPIFPIGTVEAWVKLNSYPTIYRYGIVAASTGLKPGCTFSDIIEVGLDGKASYYLWDGYGIRRPTGTTVLNLNEWYHLAVTVAPTQSDFEVSLYVNGNLEDTVWSGGYGQQNPLFYFSYDVECWSSPDYSHENFDGAIDEVAIYNRALTIGEIQQHYQNGLEGKGYEETLTNQPPTADAGENIGIPSEYQYVTVIEGTASDPDDDALTYRWLEGATELSSWQEVGLNGEAYLNLNSLGYFSIGDHTLTLEVSDEQATASNDMILTIDNSSPHAAPTGGGVYEIYTPVILGGQVSDFDGDSVSYEWREGSVLLFSGIEPLETIYGGDPVDLPVHTISDLSLGTHTLTLSVSDGVNDSVTSNIIVEIVDTTVPTLAPEPNKTILWPPNHNMVDIFIEANASDNSGSVTLSATVASDEPEDGLGDGDMIPDWSVPAIDQENGIITLQLRSERSGSGDGRIYTVTIMATDESGNSSQASVEIIVPHDKGKKK